jgi:hypothetical protein
MKFFSKWYYNWQLYIEYGPYINLTLLINLINFITYYLFFKFMLPKVQQSSLASTLKRDNLAIQVLCIYSIINQLKINSKKWSINQKTKITNHGKVILRPKIYKVHLEIFRLNIFRNKNLNKRKYSNNTK